MWYTINYENTHITYQYKLPPIASFIPEGSNKPREFALLIIPQGYYNTKDEIMKTLNTISSNSKAIRKEDNAPTFGYNYRTKKIFINLHHGDRITFKPKLASILGINR